MEGPLEISAEEVLVRDRPEVILDQANVAALLAPGPLVILDGGDRSVRVDLSDLPDRRVVRILCLSGLGDLSVEVSLVVDGPYGGRDGGRMDIEAGDWSNLASWRPTTDRSLELLGGKGGRFGKGGLDNSVYVIAGIVPSPIHPFSGGLLLDDGVVVDGVFVAVAVAVSPVVVADEAARIDRSSSRDILRASRRSIRSLH